MSILAFLASLLCILVGLHVYIRYRRHGRLLFKIPGPPGLPIIGNVLDLHVTNLEDYFKMMDPILERYYPIVKFWGATLSSVKILTAEDAEVLLTSTKHIEKSIVYKFLKPWLAEGLLLSRGSKWHDRRKILTPAFHFNVLQKYFTVLEEHGEQIVRSLNNSGKEKIVELVPFLTYHTLSAICETAMGITFERIDSEEVEKYRKAVIFVGEQNIYRALKPWFYIDFIFDYLTPRGWEQSQNIKLLHNFTRKIINERKEYHKKTEGAYLKNIATSYEENDDISKGKKKRLAMLDLLIAASLEGLIDENGIAEEVDTFVFEGHDTVSMALVYVIQLLAEHTAIQKNARAEIDEVWDSCDGKFNMSTLNRFPYLERCIKESLRLYPSVHFISRETPEDIKLTKYTVPAGTMLDIHIYDVHRDPKHWPEPTKFDPDRFLPEKIADRHPFCYIPFSAGSRNCIGQRFAMIEMKIFTLYILRHFELTAFIKTQDIGRMMDIVNRPLKKVHVKFKPITRFE